MAYKPCIIIHIYIYRYIYIHILVNLFNLWLLWFIKTSWELHFVPSFDHRTLGIFTTLLRA